MATASMATAILRFIAIHLPACSIPCLPPSAPPPPLFSPFGRPPPPPPNPPARGQPPPPAPPPTPPPATTPTPAGTAAVERTGSSAPLSFRPSRRCPG